jgi:hypothetical protein
MTLQNRPRKHPNDLTKYYETLAEFAPCGEVGQGTQRASAATRHVGSSHNWWPADVTAAYAYKNSTGIFMQCRYGPVRRGLTGGFAPRTR